MKVLLLQDVAGVGQKNDVVEAKEGYARNFLLPKKLAVVYKGQAVKIKESLVKAKEDELVRAEEDAKRLENEKLEFAVKVGDKGEVFGGVNREMIEKRLIEIGVIGAKAQVGQSLKELGEHKVSVSFGGSAKGEVTIVLVAEE